MLFGLGRALARVIGPVSVGSESLSEGQGEDDWPSLYWLGVYQEDEARVIGPERPLHTGSL